MMMHIVYPELFLYLTLFNPNGKPALTLFIYINILTYGASLVAQMQGRRPRFNPCVRKVLWRRKWQPTPAFLPEESHEQRSLEGYSPQGLQRVGHHRATDYEHTKCRAGVSTQEVRLWGPPFWP